MNAAVELLEETRHLGLRLSIKGDKLRIEPAPEAKMLERLKAAKRDLMGWLRLEVSTAEACTGLSGYITAADLLENFAPKTWRNWKPQPIRCPSSGHSPLPASGRTFAATASPRLPGISLHTATAAARYYCGHL